MNGFRVEKWRVYSSYGIISISVFLLAITLFRYEIYQSGGIIKLLNTFNLAQENNFASWWSGILLLMGGIYAFDGYLLLRQRQPTAAKGWVLIAIILFILSADEISSIHERADQFLPFEGWLSLLPFAVILLGMLAYALISLWSMKNQRANVFLLTVGFLVLGSVALQEFLEFRIDWTHELRRFRTVIEEGTELLGIIILLKVSMTYAKGLSVKKNELPSVPTLELVCLLRVPLLITGLILVPLLAYISSTLSDQHRGHPADWFAAMIFLFAGLAVSRPFFKNGENIGWPGWVSTALCSLASASSVGIHPKSTMHFDSTIISFRMLVFFILSFGISATWIFTPSYSRRTYTPFVIIIAPLAIFSIFQTDLLFAYALPQFLGLFVYYVNSKQSCEITSSLNKRKIEPI